MISLFMYLSMALARQDAPRLRTLLDNGAVVLVENDAGAKGLSVQLFSSSRCCADSPETSGWRHVVEHLLLRGISADCEAKGMVMSGKTFRDFTTFDVLGRTGQLDDALLTIGSLFRNFKVSPPELEVELKILDHEGQQLSDSALLGAAAWKAAFGSAVIDPFGDLKAMRSARVDQLEKLAGQMLAPQNLVLVIVGSIDLDKATVAGKKLLMSLKRGTETNPLPKRGSGKAARVEIDHVFGESRSALVGSFGEPRTAACLAVALALASGQPDSFVSYTPSTQPGLVVLGQTGDNSGLGLRIDELSEIERRQLFPIGRELAKRWVDGYLVKPSGKAFLRGSLLVQGLGNKPETLQENIESLTMDQFLGALRGFSKEECVIAVGTGK